MYETEDSFFPTLELISNQIRMIFQPFFTIYVVEKASNTTHLIAENKIDERISSDVKLPIMIMM